MDDGYFSSFLGLVLDRGSGDWVACIVHIGTTRLLLD
jgi:hypothetical protein